MTDPSAATAPARPARKRLFQHPGRVAIITVTLLVAFNLGLVVLNESDTSTPGKASIPVDIEAVSPLPGQLTGLIDTVTVDLADRYTGVLVIDGIEIPEDQLQRVEGIQTVSFRPGPNKELSQFRPGENTVTVKYWDGRLQDRPAGDKGIYSYSWTFKASA
jgi:hypothetical protein